MATKETPKKEAPKSDKETEQAAMENAPQAEVTYKPDANTITDNRRSDYDQPNLINPDSQKVTKDESVDENADKPENHKGEKAWDINVKEDDEANKKEANK